MYIFELLFKAFKSKKYINQSFNPLDKEELNLAEDCEHLFLPLDSSNELFACKYCGIVVERDKLKDRNIFRNSPKK